MDFFLAGVVILVFAGLLSFFPSVGARARGRIAFAGNLCALILCGGPAVSQLLHPAPVSLMAATSIPGLNFSLRLDCLSAIFLVCLLMISCLSSLYGISYFGGQGSSSAPWFWFNVLVASMAMVLVSANAFLFLFFWEAMALSSFFLVLHDSGKKDVREAAWIYAVSSHFGLVCIISLFFLLSLPGGDMEFASFANSAHSRVIAAAVFLLSLAGFGAKAGFIPFHVWLPRAHPAAPSPVSALMSGVMIKLGIYGILRVLVILGGFEPWWGLVILSLGITSGIIGVVFAFSQHDIKKLLAYHSIENIGIIMLGSGLGVLGICCGVPAVSALAFAGALLHVFNHSVFKSLLFMCAGAVIKATGTHNVDEMGGLMKKMPVTGACFLTGASAISGLPVLNGFVSEFLIFLAALHGLSAGGTGGKELVYGSVATVVALSLIGALALGCFAKACGIMFLGEGRTECCNGAKDPCVAMLLPMMVLSGICFLVGIGGVFAVRLLANPVLELVEGLDARQAEISLLQASYSLGLVGICALAFLVLVIGGLAARTLLLRGRKVLPSVTWDCGYSESTARMQYSGSSFARPTLEFFCLLLGTHRKGPEISPPFPATSSFSTHTPDFLEDSLFRHVVNALSRCSEFICRIEKGSVHLQILLVVVALFVILAWSMLYG